MINSVMTNNNITKIQNNYRKKEEDDSVKKLASGNKINSAADDAAGFVISESLQNKITSQYAKQDNVADALSALRVADGAMNEITSIVQRQSELLTRASSGTFSDADRSYYQAEIDQLTEQIGDIVSTTNFNDIPLLSVDEAGSVSLSDYASTYSNTAGTTDEFSDALIEAFSDTQVVTDFDALAEITENAANTGALNITVDGSFSLTRFDASAEALGISNLKSDSASNIQASLDSLKNALTTISSYRAISGAQSNVLEHASNNLAVSTVNHTSSLSSIKDTDMAEEAMNLSKENILKQSKNAMFAQSNAETGSVLRLFGLLG